MLALSEYELLTCQGCGGWLPETTTKEADSAYQPPEPYRCHSCDALQTSQEHHHKNGHRPTALRWPRPELKPRRR